LRRGARTSENRAQDPRHDDGAGQGRLCYGREAQGRLPPRWQRLTAQRKLSRTKASKSGLTRKRALALAQKCRMLASAKALDGADLAGRQRREPQRPRAPRCAPREPRRVRFLSVETVG